jgi:hypothetical protein
VSAAPLWGGLTQALGAYEIILVNENKQYAIFMSNWIESLDAPEVEVAVDCFSKLKSFWVEGTNTDLSELREKLWNWVDLNNGPRIDTDKRMLYVRLIICLTSEDNRELEDMGFFDDLLVAWGISRSEISKKFPRKRPLVGT